MESLEITKTKNIKKIFLFSAVFLIAATIVSFTTTVMADGGEEVASFRTMNTAIVKGSEKVPKISVKQFFMNVGKNTGLYKMIHTPTEEEIAIENAEKTASLEAESFDPFAGL